MSLDDDAQAELARLAATHRLRTPRIVDGRQGPRVVVDGVACVNLSSNDYLGLAGDPRLVEAGQRALETAGAGAGASRLVVGNHREHVALEEAVAAWLRVGGVRLFNAGYAANVGVISGLLGAGDTVFSDELNHASLIDGCRLSRARVVVYPHGDLVALEAELAKASSAAGPEGEPSAGTTSKSGSLAVTGATSRGRRIILSESLFSMDGDIVDVRGLAALAARYGASWILDEAHALGVLGPEGRGVAAALGVVPDVLIGTFGKAFGSFGAFAASSRAIADLLWNRARSLVFSTGLPPALPAMARAALEIVRGAEGDRRRQQVADATCLVRTRLGMPSSPHTPYQGPGHGPKPDLVRLGVGPIVPLVVGEDRRVMRLTQRLLEAGIFAQGIRPPTVPEGTARLRISLSAGHDLDDLDLAMTALDNAMR